MPAQLVQTNRFELPLDQRGGMFDVVPAEKEGVFLFRRLLSGKDELLQIIKLDTSFAKSWQGYLDVDKKFELMSEKYLNGNLYLLFRHREIVRKDLELVIMEGKTGTFRRYNVRNYIPFIPNDFQITREAVIIGGYFNSVPVAMYYSLRKGTSKMLAGLLNESGELTQIKTDTSGFFQVLISARNAANHKTIWIRSYDPEGDLITQFSLRPENNKHLIFARSLITDNSTQLLAGTYGNRNSEYSKGIFIATVDPNGYQQVKYYNYGDLENFFNYMKVRREQRVKERIERRKIRGKKIRFNYRFIVHEIVPYNNQYVLLGEAFYPKYVSLDRGFSSGFFGTRYFGNHVVRDGRIFDGFRYTHAVVMGFNQDGKLLWDNSFEINDVKTFTLEQFVRLDFHEDHIALFYLFENQIRTKIIQGNEVLEGKNFAPLKTMFNGDVAVTGRSTTSRLEYWYDDHFYAFGTQEIANASTGTRSVFFLNKISYRKDH